MLILAAVLAAWGLREIKAAEARGEAREAARVADSSWTAISDSIDGAWAARYAIAHSAIDSLANELDATRTIALTEKESALETIRYSRSTISTLRDSVNLLTADDAAAISAAFDSAEAAIESCHDALEVCEAYADTLEARIHDVEAQLAQSIAVNATQNATIDRLKSVQQPFMGTGGWLSSVAADVAIVVLVVR